MGKAYLSLCVIPSTTFCFVIHDLCEWPGRFAVLAIQCAMFQSPRKWFAKKIKWTSLSSGALARAFPVHVLSSRVSGRGVIVLWKECKIKNAEVQGAKPPKIRPLVDKCA